MKQLIIGLGQIGTAINKVLSDDKNDTIDGFDLGYNLVGTYDIIHICIPCKCVEEFIKSVNYYKQTFLSKEGLCIIHSTVPVGTSKKINAVHSPVRGIHPNLVIGIKTFVKYFGGARAEEASKIFQRLGIKTKTTSNSDTTEALKLWDTTIYAWNVVLEKAIYKWCVDNNVDYDLVYTHANETYNEGYEELEHPEYKKYILKHMEGPIGGHCLMPNARLLDSWIADLILAY